MAVGYGKPCPKPASRLVDRIAYKKERDAKGRTFRADVWKKAGGHCERCGVRCIRSIALDPKQGHVHHKRGRNVAPEDRFNPQAAELLCALCHLALHGQRL